MIGLIPEAALLAIGRVVAAWSHLEQTFDMIFEFIVIRDNEFEYGDPRLGRLGDPFKVRLRDLRAALTDAGPPNLVAWESALSKTGNLRDKRDVVAHGVWNAFPIDDPQKIVIDQERVHLSYKSYRNQRPHDWGTIKIATIDKRATQIEALNLELAHLLLSRGGS